MRLPLSLIILLLAWPGQVCAADQEPALRLLELEQQVEQLQQANEVLEQVIRNLISRLEALESKEVAGSRKKAETMADSGQRVLQPEIEARIKKESQENFQLIQAAFEQRLGKGGGMLLPTGQLVYEPGLSYAHSSYDRVAIDGFSVFPVLVVGDIVSERVRRDIISNNHTFRLGLPWSSQFDLVVPLGYEHQDTYRQDSSHAAKTTKGLGDISLALSHQLCKAHTLWPDSVLALSWKSTSGQDPYRLSSVDELTLGTGFETWALSLTSMTTSDPVVLFAGLSASLTPSKNKAVGKVDPGESLGASLGLALALNFDTSLSFNYQYRYTLETKINNVKMIGSDLTTSTFTIGLSRAMSSRYSYDLDLGIGLTRDSPDFQISLSCPFRFTLFAGND